MGLIPPPVAPAEPPICPYCGGQAILYKNSAQLYGGRDYGPTWACPCGARVGCHPGSTQPLGRLADERLRQCKKAAHAALDALWKRKMLRDKTDRHQARGAAYRWLAGQLGIPEQTCHIGWMDEAGCRAVIEVCGPYLRPEEAGSTASLMHPGPVCTTPR